MGFRRRVVLIASDNQIFTMYLSIVLNRMGFDVIPSDTPIKVIDLLKRFTPDIVLLSVKMPDLHWLKAIRGAKEVKRKSSISVILISDESDKDIYQECLRMGCSGFLPRPVDLAELNKILFNFTVLPGCRRRRSLRVSFGKKIAVTYNGVTHNFYAVTLSEGGIYIRKRHPLPIGEKVEIAIPLKNEELLCLQGTVIAQKGLYGDLYKIEPGIAVEFNNPSSSDSVILRSYITELLAGDILDEQEEPFFLVSHDLLERH